LISAIANDFNRRYKLNLSDRNILLTPVVKRSTSMPPMPLEATPAAVVEQLSCRSVLTTQVTAA